MSFGEFVSEKRMSPTLKRGFQMHVRMHAGDFNYRRPHEWEQLHREFLTADRSRRIK